MHDFLNGFSFIVDNWSLVSTKTGEQLALAGEALAIAFVLSVPLGIWLGHIRRGSFLAINVSNILRALPSLAVIALGIPFLGVSAFNIVVALTVLIVPVMLTNAYVAIEQVDAELVDAARGMGMRPLDVVRRVELPLALPLIFVGIRTSATYVIATATLGGIAGGGGLGDIIANQASYGLAGVWAGAIVVAALALITEGLLALASRVLTPTPLRVRHSALPDPTAPLAQPIHSTAETAA